MTRLLYPAVLIAAILIAIIVVRINQPDPSYPDNVARLKMMSEASRITPSPEPTPAPTLVATPRPTAVARTAPPKPAPVATGDVWWRLALCESGGTNANTGNGFHGYFQFTPSTWRWMGGTGLPHHHSYEEQKRLAIKLLNAPGGGWKHWPACSRKLGLR